MSGRHDGERIAAARNRGELEEAQIVWGMDLVPYTPTNRPRHLACEPGVSVQAVRAHHTPAKRGAS